MNHSIPLFIILLLLVLFLRLPYIAPYRGMSRAGSEGPGRGAGVAA